MPGNIILKVSVLLFFNLGILQTQSDAQGKFSFDAGIDNSLPVGRFHEYYTFGFGPAADVNFAVSPKLKVYLTGSYMKYLINTRSLGISGSEFFIPMLLGGKFYLINEFYILAGAGVNLDQGNVITPYRIIQAGAGRKIFKNIAAEIKYERTGKYDFTPQVVKLRIAYSF